MRMGTGTVQYSNAVQCSTVMRVRACETECVRLEVIWLVANIIYRLFSAFSIDCFQLLYARTRTKYVSSREYINLNSVRVIIEFLPSWFVGWVCGFLQWTVL